VIRAHQVKENGYEMHKFGNMAEFPACITVFSAPNYCGTYANRGAVITLFDNNLKLKTYT
jgi:serine/threonine-protein phosphatase 2B catalytic subunit